MVRGSEPSGTWIAAPEGAADGRTPGDGPSPRVMSAWLLREYEEGDVPTLFVKCRACGHEIPTPVAEPKTGAEGVKITGLRIKCPDCGHDARYSTPDFHVLPSGKSPPAGSPVASQGDLAGEHEAKKKAEQEKLAGLGIVPPEGRSPHEG